MQPKIDVAARKAMAEAAAARASERKKKRPVVEAGPYELKRVRKGPRTDLPSDAFAQAQEEVVAGSTERSIPVRVPLGRAAQASTVGTPQQGVS